VESPSGETAAAPEGKVAVVSIPFAPAGAGPLGDILPIDVAAVERGLQTFLEEFAGTGASAVAGLSEARPVGWLLAGLAGAALGVEVTRRRFREPAVELLGGSVEDSTGTWPSF
jgi:hypothetical protein